MTTLAARDQENLIHGHQKLAASKPLNQGIKALAPKTPGGNNGGKSTVNDKLTIRNRGGYDENTIGGPRTGKGEKLTFITPVAPRDRAPLGAKTTNVKANAFQTPGPLGGGNGLQKTQRRTTSAKKAKIKIHQPEAVEAEPLSRNYDDDEPEIEYCPPRPIELPDLPDNPYEFEPNKVFPNFDAAELFRSLRHYSEQERYLRYETEKVERYAKANAQLEKELEDAMEKAFRDEDFDAIGSALPGAPANETWEPLPIHQSKQMRSGSASTLKSKAAVVALSAGSTPRFAAPTRATDAKRAASKPPASLVARATPGSAASRTTLGYSAGRKLASSLKPSTNVPASPLRTRSPNQAQTKSEVHRRLLFNVLDDDNGNDDSDILFPSSHKAMDWLDDLMDPNFRLELAASET